MLYIVHHSDCHFELTSIVCCCNRKICTTPITPQVSRSEFPWIQNDKNLQTSDRETDSWRRPKRSCEAHGNVLLTSLHGPETLVCSELRCGRTEWNCGGGYCIPLDMHCDGVAQCPDLSDESECAALERCTGAQFRCGDGTCLPLAFRWFLRYIIIYSRNNQPYTILKDIHHFWEHFTRL